MIRLKFAALFVAVAALGACSGDKSGGGARSAAEEAPWAPAQSITTVEQSKTPTADQLADADVILTASFAALGEDYLTGQIDPKSVAQNWHIDPQEENVDSALARSLHNPALDKAIATMRPEDRDYTGLRTELDRFQRIVAKGGWPRIPSGKPVKPGEPMAAARIAALRNRLTLEGITPPSPGAQTTSGAYDRGLAGALAEFQARHGIVVDSMLGGKTLTSLNKPA